MTSIFRIVVFLGAAMLLGGCISPTHFDKLNNPRDGMIYGSVQASDPIAAVSILRNIKFGHGSLYPHARVYPNGVFMVDNLPPGTYWIDSMNTTDETYTLLSLKDRLNPEKFRRHLIRVAPGQMVYVGSYRIQVIRKATKNSSGSV